MWLAGFFNPQSFLTAIMQSMARKNEWPLDKMCLSVEVTKKNREDMTAPPREGSYVYGLFMEGNEGAGLRSFQSWSHGAGGQRLAGAGGRGAWKGHVDSRLDTSGDSGTTRRTCSDGYLETKHVTQGNEPGKDSRVFGCELLSRGGEEHGPPRRARGQGAWGIWTSGGASAPTPVPPPRGPADSNSREGAGRYHPRLLRQMPQGRQAAWSLRRIKPRGSFPATNRPTQRLTPPPCLWGCQGLAGKGSGCPSPHVRDKHNRRRSPCLFWNDRQETQTPVTG